MIEYLIMAMIFVLVIFLLYQWWQSIEEYGPFEVDLPPYTMSYVCNAESTTMQPLEMAMKPEAPIVRPSNLMRMGGNALIVDAMSIGD